METPYLDRHLKGLIKLRENKNISGHGEGLLNELVEIKKRISIETVSFEEWITLNKYKKIDSSSYKWAGAIYTRGQVMKEYNNYKTTFKNK